MAIVRRALGTLPLQKIDNPTRNSSQQIYTAPIPIKTSSEEFINLTCTAIQLEVDPTSPRIATIYIGNVIYKPL